MARKALSERNDKRKKLIEKYAEKRAELKKIIQSHGTSLDEKENAYKVLEKLPRDSSKVRYRNRCQISGRPRAYMRTFGISRIDFREMAHDGLIPGITKSSW